MVVILYYFSLQVKEKVRNERDYSEAKREHVNFHFYRRERVESSECTCKDTTKEKDIRH